MRSGFTRLVRRTSIRKVSARRAREMKEYAKKRAAYLTEHPTCEVCGQARATQIHHTKRRGKFYLDESSWCGCCFHCHHKIESDPKWAEENGYLDKNRNSRKIIL